MARKIQKKKNVQRRPVQATVESKLDRIKRFLKRFWIIIVSIISIAFTLFVSDIRPKIRIDEIRQTSSDPFKHEFVVTNDGRLSAKYFTTRIKIDLIDEYKNKLSFGEMKKFLPTDSVEIFQNQKIPFTLEKAVYFSGGWKVKDAVVEFFFNYTTFIGYPTFIDSVCYRTFPVEDKLVWRVVGPNFQNLDKR